MTTILDAVNEAWNRRETELTVIDRSRIERVLDWYAQNIREWWTRSEVVLSNARLGILVER